MTEANSLDEAKAFIQRAADESPPSSPLESLAYAADIMLAHLRSLAPPPPVKAEAKRIYPCADCGTMRSESEGGRVFTVCDGCWDKRRRADANRKDEENGEAKAGVAHEGGTPAPGPEALGHPEANRPGAQGASGASAEEHERPGAVHGRSSTPEDESGSIGGIGISARNEASPGVPVTAVPEGAMPEVLPAGTKSIRGKDVAGWVRSKTTHEPVWISPDGDNCVSLYNIDRKTLPPLEPAPGRTGKEPSDEELKRIELQGYAASPNGSDSAAARRAVFRAGREFERSLTPSRAPGSVETAREYWTNVVAGLAANHLPDTPTFELVQRLVESAFNRGLNARAGSEGE